MDRQDLASSIKELRKRKGFSQEQLAEESMLSLRTIQRIESGASVPRGNTLLKLTAALSVTPDDVLERPSHEDSGYLTLLHAGALAFIIHPFLGVVVPLVMWVLKKDSIKSVDDTGKKLLSFQLTWTIVLLSITLLGTKGSVMIPNISFKGMLSIFFRRTEPTEVVLLLLYLYNFAVTMLNIWRCRIGLKTIYIPAVPFFK